MAITYPTQPHAHPRRYQGTTIDIHAHWYPAEWIKVFERDGAKYGTGVQRGADGYALTTGKISNRYTEEFVDIDMRLAGMDRQGVDVHALSLTTPMVYFAPASFGLALAQCYNDACAAAHQKHPKRLYGLAQLPMQDPALALKELERAARLPGIKGLYLATNINGNDLDDKSYWDIYAKVEELGWTIFLHPVDTVGKERMTKFYLRNLCGNPYDTGIAAAHIIFGGVLDAFPKLGFNLPHAGGTFPALIGRWDHGTKMRPELKHMKRLPSEYLRRFTYDTIGHSDTINMNLVRMVGADRVTLGSDYCFDMGLEHPHDTVESLTALSDADRDFILGKNAARLLGIA
ncbi:MAG: amidohydrolase family protein [Burkholderiales bacterium]